MMIWGTVTIIILTVIIIDYNNNILSFCYFFAPYYFFESNTKQIRLYLQFNKTNSITLLMIIVISYQYLSIWDLLLQISH